MCVHSREPVQTELQAPRRRSRRSRSTVVAQRSVTSGITARAPETPRRPKAEKREVLEGWIDLPSSNLLLFSSGGCGDLAVTFRAVRRRRFAVSLFRRTLTSSWPTRNLLHPFQGQEIWFERLDQVRATSDRRRRRRRDRRPRPPRPPPPPPP